MQLFNCTGIFVSVEKSAQVFAVGGNDLFVPVERIFSVAVIGAVAFVVGIDVDETVALGHLFCGFTDKINKRPTCIPDKINRIFHNGIAHCIDMFTIVVNAVGVVHFSVN